MGVRDARVDAYIDNAAEFARPILAYLRDTVHAASPEISETIKWGFPNFVHQGIVCHMAAFKRHCAFGFWKGSLVLGEGDAQDESGMGQFGRITAIADLPPRETLIAYVRKAVELNAAGVKAPRSSAAKRREAPPIPEAFRLALDANPEAREAFARLRPSHRQEYVEWIAEAKREETRTRRIAKAMAWIVEGKSRNWKYEKKTG